MTIRSMVLLGTLGGVLAACARPRVDTADARPLVDSVVFAHDSFSLASVDLGEQRAINVYLPREYRDSFDRRFPVLYMPDGGTDEDFPHVVRAVDSLMRAGAIAPWIVVGIPNTQRRRDLTGPTRVASDSAIAPHVGESAAFRQFVQHALIPSIDARYRTTHTRAMVGESLAGLFVVETMLRTPELFDRYVAFDPSLWWNRGQLVDSAAALLQRRDRKDARLYVGASRDAIDPLSTRVAEALRLNAGSAMVWKFVSRPDATHATIFRTLEGEGLAFALR